MDGRKEELEILGQNRLTNSHRLWYNEDNKRCPLSSVGGSVGLLNPWS